MSATAKAVRRLYEPTKQRPHCNGSSGSWRGRSCRCEQRPQSEGPSRHEIRSLLAFRLRFAFSFVPALTRLAACLAQLTVSLLCCLARFLRNLVCKLSSLSRRRISVFVVASATTQSNRNES